MMPTTWVADPAAGAGSDTRRAWLEQILRWRPDTWHRGLVRKHRHEAGKFHAIVAASTETAAGLGLAAGLLTPIPAAVSSRSCWSRPGPCTPNGFFIVKEGWEYNLVLAVARSSSPLWGRKAQPGLSHLWRLTSGSPAGRVCLSRWGWVGRGPSASWSISTARRSSRLGASSLSPSRPARRDRSSLARPIRRSGLCACRKIRPRHDLGMLLEQSPALALGHAAPHPELDLVVERLRPALLSSQGSDGR